MIHFLLAALRIVAVVGVISSSIYYLLCIFSAWKFLQARAASGHTGSGAHGGMQDAPPLSILKPLKGIDPEVYECFRSHCLQDYPEYEIIFGVSDPNDPVIDSVKQLQAEFPDRRIELVVCAETLGANVKVSNLAQMVGCARFDYLIVNDSDIRVAPDYVRRVTAPLGDDRVGMVTCLYRGVAAATLCSRLESLGISTDFCAGVLVARQVEGGIRFGLGSTLAFRRSDLKKTGGFISIVNHLADDYELGKSIAQLGLRVELSDVMVETNLPAYGMREFFAHQVRWARGVRDARSGGYLGLAFTFGIFWALMAVIASGGSGWSWVAFGSVLLCRLVAALIVGWVVLRDRQVFKFAWLIPLRDLIAVALWVASLAGHTVTWRGERFLLEKGKLTRITSQGERPN
jgi:ceramide glucosyltransferase